MSTFGKCEGGGRRSASRAAAPLIALVTTLQETRSAVVVDLSANGARLLGKNLPPKWADMFVHIEGVVGFGTVQWENGDERGIAFDVSLHPDDEQFLREKIADAKGLAPETRAAFDDWTQGVAH